MSRSRMARHAAATLLAGVIAAAGLRELINASTFQLFGEYVARVPIDTPVVALTFDDGPHPLYTGQVLDVLDRFHAKATFFMMGRNVERFPTLVREVVERGHEVGNHSYSHPRLILMSPARIREEIERTDKLLREAGV